LEALEKHRGGFEFDVSSGVPEFADALGLHGYATEVQRRRRLVAVFNAPYPASRVLAENCVFFADVGSNLTPEKLRAKSN